MPAEQGFVVMAIKKNTNVIGVTYDDLLKIIYGGNASDTTRVRTQ